MPSNLLQEMGYEWTEANTRRHDRAKENEQVQIKWRQYEMSAMQVWKPFDFQHCFVHHADKELYWQVLRKFADKDDERSRNDVEMLFRDLADRWERETSLISSSTQLILHPAYQRIVGMGSRAIPLLLNELRNNPAHWFWALTAITGENPIQPDNTGNVPRMAEDWLAWGIKHGYISK